MSKYYSPEGNIEVWDTKPEGYYTPEEWEAMHPAPPPPLPTKEEKLAALDFQYDVDKSELVKYYGEAGLMGETALQEELRLEMADLDATYAEERKAIEEGRDE